MSAKGISTGRGTVLYQEEDNDPVEAPINAEGFDLN